MTIIATDAICDIDSKDRFKQTVPQQSNVL